jgi:hypothetical protein
MYYVMLRRVYRRHVAEDLNLHKHRYKTLKFVILYA